MIITKLQDYLQLLKIKQYQGAEAILIVRRIVEYLRPANKKNTEDLLVKWAELVSCIRQDEHLKTGLYNLLANVIINSNVTELFTENGITTSATFLQQARRIIGERIIPAYKDPIDINTVLNEIFTKKWDAIWLAKIPKDDLGRLINGVNEHIKAKENDIKTELYNAAKMISYRIASLGLEKEILLRANQKEALLTPFTQQNIELNHLLTHELNDEEKEVQINNIRVSLIQCQQSLVLLEKNSAVTGTSINQTFLLRRLDQNINRLKFIVQLLQKNKQLPVHLVHQFLEESLVYLKTKNNLRSFVSNNLNLLAYRVVDHTKETGEKYITSSRKDYWKMFAAAAGGGFVVSILVIFKYKIGTLQLPVFWEGFLYSLNYALGFIAIQLLGFVLATKQPAMTASSIANALKGTDRKDFAQMSVIISQVSRTQFISIMGNILLVIPFTILWYQLYLKITGTSFVESTDAAFKLLKSNHPLYSGSILYASIAGVFLFVSGLVSGFIDNKITYERIPERLEQSSALKNVMPKSWFRNYIQLVRSRSGAIMGNATLGLLLGMSTFIGKILGIPFDIRHITFAGGNIALGLMSGGSVEFSFILACFVGLGLIGIFNLAVSFSLAFYVAFKARQLHLSDYPTLSKTVFKHFITRPLEFFVPPLRGYSTFKYQSSNNPFAEEFD
jgi:site-specific recombinase